MPLLPWMRKDKEGDDKAQLEISLNEDTQKKLDAALSLGDDLKKMREQLEGLNSIQAFVSDQKKKQEDAERAAAAAKARESASQNDEELQNLILTDPAAAIRRGTQDQSVAILTLRADQIKRDVFEDEDRFPFYTGEVKSEIDKLLAGQNLQARNDPSVVENCYFTIVGKHAREAQEGKLKSRFAASSGSRGTSSTSAGGGKSEENEKLEINDDIRRAARITGMEPEAYAKMLYEQGVGYV